MKLNTNYRTHDDFDIFIKIIFQFICFLFQTPSEMNLPLIKFVISHVAGTCLGTGYFTPTLAQPELRHTENSVTNRQTYVHGSGQKTVPALRQ